MKEKISNERKEYLFKKKRKKLFIFVTQILILVFFILLWETLANKEVIDSFITSQPSRIFNTLINLSSNGLLKHIVVTSYETVIGFLIGTILGIVIAVLLWWNDFFSKITEPYLVVLNSLPKVALGPIIIVWVGAGTKAIIVMAVAISLIVTILENLNGFLHTDKELIKMAKTFNCSKTKILFKIVIPSNISTFINSLKVNIGLSLVGVISGEFLVSKAGLGYLIVYGGQVFKLDLVMTSVLILGILAVVMYGSILLLEKFILKVRRV
jgi:NitT/TauT family transport system permease protein